MSNTVRELVGVIPRQFKELYRLGFTTSPDETLEQDGLLNYWILAMGSVIVVSAVAVLTLAFLSEMGVNHPAIVILIEICVWVLKMWMYVTGVSVLAIGAKAAWAVTEGDDD